MLLARVLSIVVKLKTNIQINTPHASPMISMITLATGDIPSTFTYINTFDKPITDNAMYKKYRSNRLKKNRMKTKYTKK